MYFLSVKLSFFNEILEGLEGIEGLEGKSLNLSMLHIK
jgi:hypothetical protein